MHLAGTVAGADLAYFFPNPTNLELIREARTDAWRSIHQSGSPARVTENYLTATTSHGADPVAAGYSYVLLPNRTPAQVADYAARPPVAVLSNSASVSAARENSLGVTGAVFWKDEMAVLALRDGVSLACNQKAVVVLRETKEQLDLAVSDPTQTNAGVIEVEFSRPVSGVISADAGITVLQQTPHLKLRVKVKGAVGKTFRVQLATKDS